MRKHLLLAALVAPASKSKSLSSDVYQSENQYVSDPGGQDTSQKEDILSASYWWDLEYCCLYVPHLDSLVLKLVA